jgi:hypothetical protein
MTGSAPDQENVAFASDADEMWWLEKLKQIEAMMKELFFLD